MEYNFKERKQTLKDAVENKIPLAMIEAKELSTDFYNDKISNDELEIKLENLFYRIDDIFGYGIDYKRIKNNDFGEDEEYEQHKRAELKSEKKYDEFIDFILFEFKDKVDYLSSMYKRDIEMDLGWERANKIF